MALLSLPTDVIDKIMSYLSYQEISRIRIVCKAVNLHCQRRLNHGFCCVRMECNSLRNIFGRFQSCKVKVGLLTAIGNSLWRLDRIYSPYMAYNICAFIPGEILDHIFLLLSTLRREAVGPHLGWMMLELWSQCDIAVQHFEEKLQPLYNERLRALTEA